MHRNKTIVTFLLLILIISLSSFKTTKDDHPDWKNLQLLPDTVTDQHLSEIMEAYSVSLGVECTHCHIEGNMADDSKEEKQIARKMMTMTNEINDKYFGKNTGTIGCMTCHNGKIHP